MVYVSVETTDTVVLSDGEELDSWVVLLSGVVELRHPDGKVEPIAVGEAFGVTPTLEKQYHRGKMVTLAPDAQFVCIEQAQYYDVLHQEQFRFTSCSCTVEIFYPVFVTGNRNR